MTRIQRNQMKMLRKLSEPVIDDSKDLQRHRTNILVVQEEWQILMNWIDFVFRITH